jgi:methyl-accepting chemotaxis protein
MTRDDAIRAHREWKARFLVAMARNERLNVTEISADNCCKFGKWLHSEAKTRFGQVRGYQECVEAHAAFHVEAGKIAQRVNDGLIQEANQMLGYDTPYAKTSEDLSVRVFALFNEAEQD